MITVIEYIKRIEKIRENVVANGLEAFIVSSDENLYYLTGKSCFPFERPFALIIWPDKDPTYFIPYLELEHLSVIEHIEDYKTYAEYPAPPDNSWRSELNSILSGKKFIGTDLYTRSEVYDFLLKDRKVKAYDWIFTMRYVKSEEEIQALRRTAGYAKNSMKEFLKKISYGSPALESLEIAKKAQKKAFIDAKFEVDGYASKFQSLAWPAPKSAEPHSIPDMLMEYKEGPHVCILSYQLDGYAVELERTFFTTTPSSECREYFSHMMKAREIALSMCKPGTKASSIDEATIYYFTSVGLEEHVIHRTGHGMGVSNHEGPFLAIGSETILRKGMIVTIEPGIYFNKLGAFRHSDTVLITETGYEILTDVPADINNMICTRKQSIKEKLKYAVIKNMV